MNQEVNRYPLDRPEGYYNPERRGSIGQEAQRFAAIEALHVLSEARLLPMLLERREDFVEFCQGKFPGAALLIPPASAAL